MKTHIRVKQHKYSTPKHKTVRTTTEVSHWNDQKVIVKISMSVYMVYIIFSSLARFALKIFETIIKCLVQPGTSTDS